MKRFQKVYFEISNICSLHCGFCPEVEREKAVMDRELFSKIIAEAAPLTGEVCRRCTFIARFDGKALKTPPSRSILKA